MGVWLGAGCIVDVRLIGGVGALLLAVPGGGPAELWEPGRGDCLVEAALV